MTERKEIILVTGATGQQGGAVVCHLLQEGWQVRALTRDPKKPAAQALSEAGVEVFWGNLDDATSLEKALDGVYGVFSVQQFWEHGVAQETIQGKRLADLAQAAGVRHFVYSSVGAADQQTGLEHFESKWKVEEHLRAIGLPHTILRPVFFMDNFLTPAYRDGLKKGTLGLALGPETRLQMVAVDDIGAFAALAFREPETYLGQAIELAGDEMTGPEMARTFEEILGQPVHFVEVPTDALRSFSDELADMFVWFNKAGFAADLDALRRAHPGLLSFAQWIEQAALGGEAE